MRFATSVGTQEYSELTMAAKVTYDSGADGKYMSKADRAKLGLLILRESTKRVGVVNGGARKGRYIIKLPFP